MSNQKNEKKKLLNKLRNKYRLVLLHDKTFREVAVVRLNRLNVIALGGAALLLLIAAFWAITAYTPVRELIPGYPNAHVRNNIIKNNILLDSLQKEIEYRDQYFNNINRIIAGERPPEFLNQRGNTDVPIANIPRSTADSILRHDIDMTEKLAVTSGYENSSSLKLDNLHFFAPVRGMVTNSFNPLNNHYGTDVVAGPNEVVKATLDGTVIMAAWTLKTGHIIQVQHSHNLISVYKHNAEILQKVGSRVKAGDAIAIIGNSGELTTGPHLHFEIWQDGVALDPEDFVVF